MNTYENRISNGHNIIGMQVWRESETYNHIYTYMYEYIYEYKDLSKATSPLLFEVFVLAGIFCACAGGPNHSRLSLLIVWLGGVFQKEEGLKIYSFNIWKLNQY